MFYRLVRMKEVRLKRSSIIMTKWCFWRVDADSPKNFVNFCRQERDFQENLISFRSVTFNHSCTFLTQLLKREDLWKTWPSQPNMKLLFWLNLSDVYVLSFCFCTYWDDSLKLKWHIYPFWHVSYIKKSSVRVLSFYQNLTRWSTTLKKGNYLK